MKTCKCGSEIREEQTICIDCYKKSKNLKWIENNEIVFDVDNRKIGMRATHRIGELLYKAGYNFEIYYAEGQKSPHIHLKNIVFLDLEGEQLKKYKELFITKFCPKEFLKDLDYTLCSKHLVAEENKTHFKYKTIKELCGVFNQDKENYAEEDLVKQVIIKINYKPNIKGSGITAEITKRISIINIANQFGLSVNNHKCLCPFHPDNKTLSLIFYEQQGRFWCAGCQVKGNIIKFYAMLKELNPKFVYHKEK